MKTLLLKLKQFKEYLNRKRIENCNHGFNIEDVVNLKIDAKCVYCGKSLSQCEKEFKAKQSTL